MYINRKKYNVYHIYLWLVIIVLGFVPLIVHMKEYDSGYSVFDWYRMDDTGATDFFLYYKMCLIITSSVIMCTLLFFRYHKKQLCWNKLYTGLLVYAACVLFSGIFSSYRFFAFRGSYELFESVPTILGYVIICIYASQMVTSEDDIRYVAKFSGIGIFIAACIGFFQFCGLDIFRSQFGKMLITPRYVWDQLDTMSFTFPLHTSYVTLYNTNYVAFYCGLLIPVILLLLLMDRVKWGKCLYGLLLIFLVITLIGSNSKSALLALGITLLFGSILFYKVLKKHKGLVVLLILAIIGIVSVYAYRLGGFQNLYHTIFVGIDSVDEESYRIRGVETLDDEIVFHIDDNALHVFYEIYSDNNVEIRIRDEYGNDLAYHMQDMTIVLDDAETYAGCTIHPMYYEEMSGLMFTIDGLELYFSKDIDGTYYYLNPAGKFCKIPKVKKAHIFPDGMMSGRGHLWNYLIPKLKSCLIFGNGANTFPMLYPNDNYILKQYTNTQSLIDVKAHSLYLQQFAENGLIALLAFLIFYIAYFIQCLKLYFGRPDYSYASIIGIGIFLGTFNYMIIAIANDSNVNTAPVYWSLIGIGIAANQLVIKQDKKQG